MRLEQLDLNLLLVFDAVYTERNLTKVAKVLNITQPAVSNALQRLRNRLDDPLFIRGSKGVSPTVFADNMAPQIHEALQLMRRGLNKQHDFSPQDSSRTFRISMNDQAEALFLPLLIEQISTLAPGIIVESSYVSRKDLVHQLVVGAVDLAIEVPLDHTQGVSYLDLCSEDYVCMVSPQQLKLPRKFTLDDYLALKHVNISTRSSGLGYVDLALRNLGKRRKIKVRTRHANLAASIVQNSPLAMSLPARFADLYGLKAQPLPFEVPPLAWRLYWPSKAEHDKGNSWLRNVIAALK